MAVTVEAFRGSIYAIPEIERSHKDCPKNQSGASFVPKEDYSRWDVITGCIITDIVAFFIIVACAATIYVSGHAEIV